MANFLNDEGPLEEGLVAERYEFRQVYHSGEQYEVRRVKDRITEESYILKRDFRTNPCPLDTESEVYQAAQAAGQPKGFAKIYYDGLYNGNRVLVMDLLARNLETERINEMGTISVFQTFSVGVAMIKILEKLHSMDFIHRNIDPTNIMIGRPSQEDYFDIHLIDFPNAIKYRRLQGEKYIHFPKSAQHPIPLSLIFGSRRGNRGQQISRKDDLESLVYTLVYLARGTLPWIDDDGTPITQDPVEMAELKHNTKADALLDNLPDVFYQFRAYVWRLQFIHTPNYQRMRAMFTGGLVHLLLLIQEFQLM